MNAFMHSWMCLSRFGHEDNVHTNTHTHTPTLAFAMFVNATMWLHLSSAWASYQYINMYRSLYTYLCMYICVYTHIHMYIQIDVHESMEVAEACKGTGEGVRRPPLSPRQIEQAPQPVRPLTPSKTHEPSPSSHTSGGGSAISLPLSENPKGENSVAIWLRRCNTWPT